MPGAEIEGVAVARHGYGRPLARLAMIEAGPSGARTQGSVDGARRALAARRRRRRGRPRAGAAVGRRLGQLGGAAGPLTLDDKRAITRHLLRSGAAIGEINTVRKRLSRIKGGRLARAAFPARLVDARDLRRAGRRSRR